MKVVKTIDEAMNFFLRNSSGSVICMKNEKEQRCDSYSEAKKFFDEN